jgi:hypothetical protein
MSFVLQILCMHGGLSPELKTLEQIKRLSRPADVPDNGLLCDLLWADPEKDIQGWGENDRGVSYTFGADAVTEFLQKHDLDLICRAHQVRFLWYPSSCCICSKYLCGFSIPHKMMPFRSVSGCSMLLKPRNLH